MEARDLGSYRLLSELGTGGMGTVYLAEATRAAPGLAAGQRVALKIVHPHLLSTAGFFKRFLREAEIGKRVRHPNVVRTLDVDALDVGGKAVHYLVMEHVDGQTLRALLRELGRVPEQLCRHIAREVARALVAIHEAGVVHRDLKPENVLITPDHVVKVMDLGVARLQDETIRLSQTGTFLGSVQYAAPEQFRGEEPDARADLHALGLVLYELSTGERPFGGHDFAQVMQRRLHEELRPVSEHNPQITPFFEELVKVLVAKDRDERFASAAALLGVLEQGERGSWWEGRASDIRAETMRPLRRVRIPRETALYGRERDLDLLHGLFGKAAAGDGRVVFVEGEAGIGKTRLVDEFVGRLNLDGQRFHFLSGGYPPGGAATAAGAFSTAFREHFGAERLEDALQGYLPETPVLVPAFAALLRGEPPPQGDVQLTKDSLQTVFVRTAQALAAERPTVVLVDDLHFAPEEGLALFAALALAAPGHRLLLVATFRPGLSEEWVADIERLDHASGLVLHRLGPKDLARLLTEAFGSRRVAEELGFRIAAKSDGNPYFVFEILQGLREQQHITRQDDGSWATTGVIEDIQVPSSVVDLIEARLSLLEDAEREVLDVAACCGFEFDPHLLADAVGMAPIPLLRVLGRIEKSHRLVRSVGALYAFDHHQVQEALCGGLSEPLRKEYHAALAASIGRRAEPVGAAAVDLCEHFLKAGRGEQALPQLATALDHLEKGHLNGPAVRLSDRALAQGGLLWGGARAAILLRRSEWLDMLGRRDEQRAAVDEALALADEGGDAPLRAKAHWASGYQLWVTSHYEEARESFTQTLELAHEALADHTERMEVRYLLWEATGDRAHLAEAHRLLLHLRDHAPEQYRESILDSVPLHREILAAAEQA